MRPAGTNQQLHNISLERLGSSKLLIRRLSSRVRIKKRDMTIYCHVHMFASVHKVANRSCGSNYSPVAFENIVIGLPSNAGIIFDRGLRVQQPYITLFVNPAIRNRDRA